MDDLKKLFAFIFIFCLMTGCRSQDKDKKAASPKLVGRCEGCEAIFEYGTKELAPVDTLPDFKDDGPKLKVTGIIYQQNGKTPAAGVVLYIYHTDQTGVYPTRGVETGWACLYPFSIYCVRG